jgi:hypothetical protein
MMMMMMVVTIDGLPEASCSRELTAHHRVLLVAVRLGVPAARPDNHRRQTGRRGDVT